MSTSEVIRILETNVLKYNEFLVSGRGIELRLKGFE